MRKCCRPSATQINVGGNTVNIGAQSAVVSGSADPVDRRPQQHKGVAKRRPNPVRVKDVAHVTSGEAGGSASPADQGDDIVQGIVLNAGAASMSSPTITRVEQLVATINNSRHPAAGRANRADYDRKDLIDITTRTCCTTWWSEYC